MQYCIVEIQTEPQTLEIISVKRSCNSFKEGIQGKESAQGKFIEA